MATARVLVVDDEPLVLSVVSKALATRGYEIHAASSPGKALEAVERTPCFDLVVSDVIMPEMCGPELVRRIERICPEVGVVLMSGNLRAEIARAIFQLPRPLFSKSQDSSRRLQPQGSAGI